MRRQLFLLVAVPFALSHLALPIPWSFRILLAAATAAIAALLVWWPYERRERDDVPRAAALRCLHGVSAFACPRCAEARAIARRRS